MNQFIIQATKKLNKLKKELADQHFLVDRVLNPLSQQIDEFKKHVPLIMKLRHPGIKTKHWEEISKVVGFNAAPDLELTLQGFLDLHFEQWMEQVTQIANVAAQEYTLETSLDQMDADLQTKKFVTSEFRNSGQFILNEIDDITSTIDDQLVTTQTILASPFIEPVKKRAQERLSFLHLSEKIIMKWISCQKNWLYLQPIFTGTSIQQKLAKEARDWKVVEQIWSSAMNATHNHPEFQTVMTRDGLFDQLNQCNNLLDQINIGLNKYLEAKRMGFPRFFFLSNDELITILSHSKEIGKVQESLSKLFEYVNTVTMDGDDIVSMNDSEGEKVKLFNPVQFDTPEIEDWLNNFEAEMKHSLNQYIEQANMAIKKQSKEEWITSFPAQVILITNQINWTLQVTQVLSGQKLRAMKVLLQKYLEQLETLTGLVRKPIDRLTRQVLSCLLILEVHNRDIIKDFVHKEVVDIESFKWLQQLRYYWEDSTVIVRSINNVFEYSYEYAGNSTRLVITPLTDRCYQTLLCAFRMNLSGAPSGPAGTGKTETVRDCAKALGRSCVVYNCSEEVTPEQMSQFFAGLSSSGSWSCFDEFNRINIEVLSVIAQQVRTIQNAIAENAQTFQLDKRSLKLNPNAAICITMNPGYAGRTELPDNLKALFRPCAMMVPDFIFISEILLFSGGFTTASSLAVKLVALFDLCRKQLSNSHHYDWGLRAMKAILSTAGKAKRNDLEANESLLLVRTIRDCTLPKLISDDIPLFNGILNDVFPNVEYNKPSNDDFLNSLKESIKQIQEQPLDITIAKATELYETTLVRHGIMLVGGAMGGKSTAWKSLSLALTDLSKTNNSLYKPIQVESLNPKAISIAELYGSFNPVTSEWADGVLSKIIREMSFSEQTVGKWIIVDGPVDSLWIESMNSLLDDNKVLCLPNNERIQLSPHVKMMFEVDNLDEASPATVSRCGMVYFDPSVLSWTALADSWRDSLLEKQATVANYVRELMNSWLPNCLQFITNDAKTSLTINPNFAVKNLLRLLNSFVDVLRKPIENQVEGEETVVSDPLDKTKYFSVFSQANDSIPYFESEQSTLVFERIFIFCLIWSFGGPLVDDSRVLFDKFIRDLLETTQSRVQFPPKGLVFDYYCDLSQFTWLPWLDGTTNVGLTSDLPIEQQLISTKESAVTIFLSRLLCSNGYHVLLQGPETSKTLSVKTLFSKVLEPTKYDCHIFPLASCSTPTGISKFLQAYMHKRQGKLGPLPNQQLIYLLDNFNSVKPEVYGAQPPLELIRQFMDYNGWYQTSPVEFQSITGTSLIATMGVPGGGLYTVPERLLSHFFILHCPPYNQIETSQIVEGLLRSAFARHSQSIQEKLKGIALAMVGIYQECQKSLLAIPSKLHYIFNMRNILHVIRGMLLIKPENIPTELQFLRLWQHEMMREFHDRFNTNQDRKWLITALKQQIEQGMNGKIDKEPMFCSFSDSSKLYKEVTITQDQLIQQCNNLLEEHNREVQKQLDIVLFPEAIGHLASLSRAFSLERGHVMLVGVKSSGRKSLAHLALYACNMEPFEISITRTFNFEEWRENLKTLMHKCGAEDEPTGFIINDVQIVMEQQLEDISNILISSEVPQLYDRDEMEQIKGEINKDDNGDSNIAPWDKFMQRIKKNLHIILVFSPYGQTFKDVMLSFTSIRNEVIIDWYMPWLHESLVSIGMTALQKANIPSNIIDSVISIMVNIHKSADDFASKFIKETKRYNAVTPSRFFELLQTFTNRLLSSQDSNSQNLKNYTQGIEKIKSTQAQIATMREQLDRDIPILRKTEKEVIEMLKELSVKSAECEATQKEVKEQSDIAEKEAAQASEANRVAQEQFAKVEPILEEAKVAVSKLDKDSLVNIKKLHNPSAGMKDTFDAVCIMFERQPRKVDGPTPGTKEEDYWPEAVSLLNDIKFINNITNFKIELMKPATINKLKKYVPTDPQAREEKKKAAQQSFAAVGAFYDWVCASFDYWNVYQEILPLKNAADEALKKLEASQTILAKAKAHLAQVEQTLKDLQDKVDAMKKREQDLKDNVAKTTARLDRANKIMSGLSGETDRWSEVTQNLSNSSKFIMGDSILISGVLTYLGVYSPTFRSKILQTWQGFLKEKDINFTNNFSIINALGNDATIRDWITKGLSNDSFSIENALIITQSPESYPLLIDPQLNGTSWLRAIDEKLVALRFDQTDFLQRLKSCIQIGIPVIIENVGLKMDPLIDPILSKEILNVDGAKTISLGGEVVNYNDNFRLYLSTKYPNPQYSPAICSQVTLINFTTTEEGLTDLLLNNLIEVERHDLDEKRLEIMEASAANIKKLKDIEKEILNIVSNAGSDILDDDKAIKTLQNAHETSQNIAQQMAASESTQKQIQEFRNQFSIVASRAALLYFCVSDFSVIDSMYQFSLKWFTSLFRTAISNAEHFSNVEDTIKSFNNTIAKNFYESVSYSLFSRHKLLFSTLMCIRILYSEKKISGSELAFLLSPTVEPVQSPVMFINDESWRQALALEKISSDFGGLTKHIQENQDKWREYMENQQAELAHIPFNENDKLSSFQRFLLLRIFHLERVREGLHIFIEENLGKEFVTPPTLNLMKVFKESNTTTPLIFIIMPGIDPQDEILGVAASMELEKYVKPYSLGRGRGQGAEELIREAADSGFIVLLQNCHLSLSWMPKLEHILNELSMEPDKINPRFRVCLVTMSDPNFPIGILYQGTKLIYEIPRGIRENIMRIYSGFNADEYDQDSSEIEKQLTFSLAFFHSVVLERLQFGSMGWNIPYEFNPSDFAISRKQLHTFLTENGNNPNDIPFEALSYVIGELNYGGRVTDSWDRRLLLSVLQRYFSEESNSQGVSFGKRYNPPSSFDLSLHDVINTLESWPTVTQSGDVGLSANASTIVARNEAMNIFNKLIEVQPTLVSSSESVSEEQFALSLVSSLQQILPRPFNIYNFKKKFTQKDTITTVLYHEIILYNDLIETISESLKRMEMGLKGLILIDQKLEILKRRLLGNRVPETWLQKSFPSILTLRNYMDDLRQRVDFLDNWMRMGTPVVYRLGAFFHPEEFLTVVLQVYARTKVVPFDTLSWKTTPISTIINESPKEGIYIEGLPLEGAKWDNVQGTLVECSQMELDSRLPVFHLVPTEQNNLYDKTKFYECPVFRTQNRGTGALDLPNYILSLHLPSSKISPDHWIQRSVAAFITVQ
ncbi:Dynein heavy chain family protein [Trichomonas vaginalis G3]|uniref:Dynein heavy chain family protein n=1 Tax=Trichomonas vaginalis (strain ATCC PRA-98 / G3) TaxID=412133 RepID=A2DY47_TRIV3|nr:Dynein heavy chain family protein [Trichomonas vaginalis G3]|eukprot:XP_001326879.1 Dynein heavy chain family protein [Trichomonas vaginalis G3]